MTTNLKLNTANWFKKQLLLLGLFILAILPLVGHAQQYPVRIIPVITPPYSLKLADYAHAPESKLQLQVLMTDLQQPQHHTGIKFFLQAGLNAQPIAQSNEFIIGQKPFLLTPGANITLTSTQIKHLFDPQNLNGLNPQQYASPLPEGLYQFCFQAYDFYTKNNLSEKACASVFLNQYDPPQLNIPQNAEKIQAINPYGNGSGILFQWMPRQVAPNTKYNFILKEIWDTNQSPISAFLASPVLWKEETFAPNLYYSIDKTQLIPGRRYAWQVQAFSSNPFDNFNYPSNNQIQSANYKNNGLSEIFFFDYVENCQTPTFLMAKNKGRGRVEIHWNFLGNPAGLYKIQYRKKGANTHWMHTEAYQNSAFISGLEDLTEYEYRVGAVCGNVAISNSQFENNENAYAFSPVQFFTTDSQDVQNNNFQCGVMPAVDISNKEPLRQSLVANDIFTAGDFPVTIIEAQGSNGIFTGTGFIQVPYLADTKIKVAFNNISINSDKKLINGTVETEYDPEERNIVRASQIWNDIVKLFDTNKEILNDYKNKGFLTSEQYDEKQKNKDTIISKIETFISNYNDLGIIPKELSDELKNTRKELDLLSDNLSCTIKDNEDETHKPKGSDEEISSNCDDKVEKYIETEKKYKQLLVKVQEESISAIKNGKLTPPKNNNSESSIDKQVSITSSYLNSIQSYCISNRNNTELWEEVDKEKHPPYGYSVCIYDNTPTYFYHYNSEEYWLVGKEWFLRCNNIASNANNTPPSRCFKIYDNNKKDYVFVDLEVGKYAGEEAAEFLAWLFVRDIPLLIVGGASGGAYEIVANGLGDPILSYLSATDKITDEQALAGQLVLALSGKVNTKTINEIKLFLTKQIKKTGKNPKQIAQELKEEIAKVSGKSVDDILLWVKNNNYNLTENEINNIFNLVEKNYDFTKRIILSTKDIIPSRSLAELANKLNLPISPSPKSLTLYEARVWYNWRKSKISELVDKTQTLENQAKQALFLRNEIRNITRKSMKDTDIADFLDSKELNMTWENAINKYGNNYQEIIQASMRGRGWLNELFKIPDIK